MTNKAKGIFALIASAFGFATMAAFVRLADDMGEKLPCIQKAFFRNAVALTIALFALLRCHLNHSSNFPSTIKSIAKTPKLFLTLLLRSTLGTCGIFANFYALSRIPIAEGQTLNKTAPFFTVIFAWLFLGEKTTLKQIAAISIAFAGVLLVAKPGFAGEQSFAMAVGLSGGLFAGAAYALVRSLRRQGAEPAIIVTFFSAFSCLACLPFIAGNFTPMTLSQVAVLIGAGAGAAVGQFGITLAYGYAAPREIAVWDYTNIIFTGILGLALFGQTLDTLSIAGFVLIVIAAKTISRA
jgi:drug/metabolite transporter (DMT)-like permease